VPSRSALTIALAGAAGAAPLRRCDDDVDLAADLVIRFEPCLRL
jgi:hypothetical protein